MNNGGTHTWTLNDVLRLVCWAAAIRADDSAVPAFDVVQFRQRS
jgi:hypothetical protein